MEIRMRTDGADVPEFSSYDNIDVDYINVIEEAKELAAAAGQNVSVYMHGCPDVELFRVNKSTGEVEY